MGATHTVRMKITGLGLCLPDSPDGRSGLSQLQKTLHTGLSHLRVSRQHNDALPVWGSIGSPDTTGLLVRESHLHKYSKATLLGAQAVRRALVDARISPPDLHGTAELLVGSTMFGLDALSRHYAASAQGGSGIDYLLQGTPGSMTSGIALLNGLETPNMTLAGSCVLGATLLTLAGQRLADPSVDTVIVVGVDAAYSPLLVDALTYNVDSAGETMGYTGTHPEGMRPLDRQANGAVWGDGAVALVLQRAESAASPILPPFRLRSLMGRNNGASPIGSGPAEPVAEDVLRLVQDGGLELSDIPVWFDFCEGTKFIQQYFAQILHEVRSRSGYTGEIKLSNCEAAYGHICAAVVLLKLLSGLSMVQHGVLYPAIGCQDPDPSIAADPILEAESRAVPRFLILAGGSGGDRAILLVDTDTSADS